MKKIVAGILAHVDSGKTTLSEAMLYTAGKIRKLGRVDHQDAYLDTEQQEKDRGITIFSKQAELNWHDMGLTLLDTPGHVDFGAEMERTLQVLDYAVLVINGMEGVQSHTETLWKLLKRYEIPVFIFVNKMDMSSLERDGLMNDIRHRLDDGCVDFCCENSNEQIAVADEHMLEYFLIHGKNRKEDISDAIKERKIFPCYFGSALKLCGIEELLDAIDEYTFMPDYGEKFGARVFKILRDAKGERLTYMKLTGGSIKCRDIVKTCDNDKEDADIKEEKVNQIRIYSGSRFETVEEAVAGTVCAVTGLENTFAGQGLGMEQGGLLPSLEPVLTYKLIYPEGADPYKLLKQIKLIEEEDPQLHVVWNEQSKEIFLKVMGPIQLQVLQRLVKDRFGVVVEFGTGHIAYKETIKTPVMGVGHFEPLRHYAEVHLMLEPLESGSGIVCDSICSEDSLDRNWQRLICTHIMEKQHTGVLTGSPVTDIKITVTAGKAHTKHTEGGDFRQATYRAVRQGLMMAETVLLEPVYDFRLEVPSDMVGRAMSDITRMCGSFDNPELSGEMTVITGKAPVSTMQEYHKELMAYSHGVGRLSLSLAGYEPCHNQDEIVADIGYRPEADLAHPSSSVFCAHGSGYQVEWYDVYDYMHVKEDEGFKLTGQEEYLEADDVTPVNAAEVKRQAAKASGNMVYTEEELEDIFIRTYGAKTKETADYNRAGFNRYHKQTDSSYPAYSKNDMEQVLENKTPANIGIAKPGAYKNKKNIKEYLLVDGYNIIFAWTELAELAKVSLSAARNKLMDILCNYQGYKGCELILVFDAYKVKENKGEQLKYNNIHVVYTKEAETADMYIEKTTHELGRKHKVTVATSDALEQLIIMGQGAVRMSAGGLKEEIDRVNQIMREQFLSE
ncbi:MAG: NYN domain-containing protein [Coprococcus sp.]